jgi:histidinol-phosphate phosphatase family protein
VSEGRFEVVIPSLGRPSLARLLASLAASAGPPPRRVTVVDDGGAVDAPAVAAAAGALAGRLRLLAGSGRGPAAARNRGLYAADAEWVAFLDDDVLVSGDWLAALEADLAAAAPDVAGIQGRLAVPLPEGRRPTDWERHVHGLAGGRWITADMAYRRPLLARLGGFDERFPRAYREDAELALRVTAAGHRLERGRRRSEHPVPPPPGPLASVTLQRGNADDVLMWALHGRRWRARAGAPRGRRRRHVAVTAAGLAALAAIARGERRAAGLAAAGWAAGTAELAWRRIAPGPRTPAEIARMLVSSPLIPPAAAAWSAVGLARVVRGRPRPLRPVEAVFFDRDGTLVVDVPYNADPDRVRPVPTARRALARLRRAGVATGVVTNQSGVGRGLLTREQVLAVNARVEALLGPLGPWLICTHTAEEGCVCRKPRPAMVLEAARRVGVRPERCAVVGDTAADMAAADAAGAVGVLVPNPVTRPEEVRDARRVADDLDGAVRMLLGGLA